MRQVLLSVTLFALQVLSFHFQNDPILRSFPQGSGTRSLTSSHHGRVKPRGKLSTRFLNKATSEFAVNGTGIPEVDFDIGESYAGLLPISKDPNETGKLYFWFFPTSNEEHKEDKEIIVWLNGGPGCSSLAGLLQENGPFVWQAGRRTPEENPWSYHHLSNVVYIDQPIGVGYTQGKVTIKNEDDLAKQFLGFWKNFIETFSFEGYKVYIAAESYGGTMGPYIASHMINTNDTTHYNMQGLIIYDGTIADRTQTMMRSLPYNAFLDQHPDVIGLSAVARQKVREVSESCGFDDWLHKYLQYPPKGPAPVQPPSVTILPDGTWAINETCWSLGSSNYQELYTKNPCFNPYNAFTQCPLRYDPLESGVKPFFDRPDVKKAINAPSNVTWSHCSRKPVFNTSTENPFLQDPSPSPDRYELPHVIEKTNNVIIAHGAMDMVAFLNGVLLGIQNMTWNGQQGFQKPPSEPFYVPLYGFDGISSDPQYYGANLPAGSGVLGTTHTERGLTFVVTKLCGHKGPGDAPAASLRHIEKLLGRIESLSEKSTFTLPGLRDITQLEGPLGNGTVPIPCFGTRC